MLKESDLSSSSAEELICKPLWDQRNTELSKSAFNALIIIGQISDEELNEMYAELIKVGGWHIEALRKRVDAIYPFSMTKREILFIGIMVNSIGAALMLVHLCLYWWSKNGKPDHITLSDLQNHIFPDGIPSDENLQKVWTQTKVQKHSGPIANLIDLTKYSHSMIK